MFNVQHNIESHRSPLRKTHNDDTAIIETLL
ncbi:uncharacterized protein METZ01_LOCUS105815, partial [marine metagenome]